MHSVLIELLTLSMAAVVFVPLFRRFGFSTILAYLFAGIIIGPSVFGLITDGKEILQISELGIVFLLFVIGLELAPTKLWQLRRAIFGFGQLQVLVCGGVLTLCGIALGFPTALSYIAGFGLALSSTAFSMQILDDNNQLNTSHGQDTFAILMFQDLAVVPILASLAFFHQQTAASFNLLAIVKIIALISTLVFAGSFLIRHILRLVASTEAREVFTAMALLIVVGAAVLMESVGLSMGTGAFFAGVLLANSEYRHELETDLEPFKGLLLGLFFIAVGMSLDLNILVHKPHWILATTIGFMTAKGVLLFFIAKIFKRSNESARNISVNLALGGEFAFVLFGAAVTQNLIPSDIASILNASVIISMALTPFLFSFNQTYLRSFSELSERPYDEIAPANVEVIVAGFGRFGQIVSRFLNAEGVIYTILDHDAEQVDAARRFGNKVYYGDASRKDILETAGAKKAKYFVLAIDDVDQSVATAKMVREHYPHLDIIARVRNRQHALDLMEMGITSVHRETYMTSLEVAKEVMLKRGKPEAAVLRAINNFRIHDEKILKNQLQYRNDDEGFRAFTTNAVRELERILTEDRDADDLDKISPTDARS